MTHILYRSRAQQWERNSPIYETLVLVYLEEKLYVQPENEFDSEFRQYKEDNFERFLDDCFILFLRSNEDLEKTLSNGDCLTTLYNG